MRTSNALSAAAGTDAGLQREVNEDRYHVDEARGLFVVIDGIGGQAAGGKAADVAVAMIRERLERETGPVPDRVREAIAIANNEIYRLSSSRPDRKSTRLNSSHLVISYAVFCLKKKRQLE